MTQLDRDRQGTVQRFGTKEFILKSGTKAFKHAIAVGVIGEGVMAPGSAATGRVALGRFAEQVDATLAPKPVAVDLLREVVAYWLAPHTTGAPTASDVFDVCYIQDDQTVTMTPDSRSLGGRIWAVDVTKGVLVEFLPWVVIP